MYLRLLEKHIYKAIGSKKALIIYGPRQTGKTTLVKKVAESENSWYGMAASNQVELPAETQLNLAVMLAAYLDPKEFKVWMFQNGLDLSSGQSIFRAGLPMLAAVAEKFIDFYTKELISRAA